MLKFFGNYNVMHKEVSYTVSTLEIVFIIHGSYKSYFCNYGMYVLFMYVLFVQLPG